MLRNVLRVSGSVKLAPGTLQIGLLLLFYLFIIINILLYHRRAVHPYIFNSIHDCDQARTVYNIRQ